MITKAADHSRIIDHASFSREEEDKHAKTPEQLESFQRELLEIEEKRRQSKPSWLAEWELRSLAASDMSASIPDVMTRKRAWLGRCEAPPSCDVVESALVRRSTGCAHSF